MTSITKFVFAFTIAVGIITTGITLSSLVGCGPCEKQYDKLSYESLTGETGTVKVLSGGQIIAIYENAKIDYSDSDTQSMWIKTSEEKKIYISGDVIVELN